MALTSLYIFSIKDSRLIRKSIHLFAVSDRNNCVIVHTPLFREVFWHEYAKILRHTSQNSIAAGDLLDSVKFVEVVCEI